VEQITMANKLNDQSNQRLKVCLNWLIF